MDAFWAQELFMAEAWCRLEFKDRRDPDYVYKTALARHGDGKPYIADRLANDTVWSVMWRASGYPRVHLGHKLAASFVATDVPSGAVANLATPWRAFALDVPDGTLYAPDYDGLSRKGLKAAPLVEITRVKILVLPDRVFIQGCADRTHEGRPDRVSHVCAGGARLDDFDSLTFPRLATPEALDDAEFELSQGLAGDGSNFSMIMGERRARTAMSRLALGVALELTSHRPALGHASGPRRTKTDKRVEPMLVSFALTRDVVVDCRESVRAYARGDGSLPTVRSVVRGHWKWQAHGPGRSLRKWIHVEPYMRGDAAAPIAVRAHAVADDPSTTGSGGGAQG